MVGLLPKSEQKAMGFPEFRSNGKVRLPPLNKIEWDDRRKSDCILMTIQVSYLFSIPLSHASFSTLSVLPNRKIDSTYY